MKLNRIFLIAMFAVFVSPLFMQPDAKAQTFLYDFTANKYVYSDTVDYTTAPADPQGYTGWLLFVANLNADSARTFTLQGLSDYDKSTGYNINLRDVSAGNKYDTLLTGQQSMSAGAIKTFEIVGESFPGFIINAQNRNSMYFLLKAIRKTQF